MSSTLGIEGLGNQVMVDQLGGYQRRVEKDSLQTGPGEGVSPGAHGAVTFTDLLKQALEKTNESQVQADTAVKEMVAGRNKNIHETMLAVERADSSLKLMMQVRNKVLDAYREIMRMQV